MSKPKSSKPKKGFRGRLHEIFGRSSSESHLPLPISTSSSLSSSRNSISTVANVTQALTPASSTPRPFPPPSEKAEPSDSAPPPVACNDLPNPRPGLHPTSEMSVSKPSNQETHGMNQIWASLRVSLQSLGSVLRVFPHLASAASVLLDCFDGLETAARNRSDYEDLARELTSLIESLEAHTNTLGSPSMTKCISGITIEIKQQAEEIGKMKTSDAAGRFLVAKVDEENMLRYYRRIQSLFRQLQTNLSMSTWSMTNAQLVERLLDALNPVKQAAYDSALSSTIGRRSCTEGTRINIMSDLNNWASDSEGPSIFWMNGMAGTGKTTIACTFSQLLEQDDRLAASFFCTRTTAECRDVTRIIPTIAYQLARYSAPFQSSLCEVLGKEPDLSSKHIQKQFERLLRDPLLQSADAMPNNLVVIIDALDECEDHNGVELILDLLFQHARTFPLKIYVTSRPEPEIYDRMTLHSHAREVIHLHEIEKSLVQADIELYLQAELTVVSPSAADIDALVQRSGALFIYAATLVRYIKCGKQSANRYRRLRSVLNMAHETATHNAQIDALYAAILESALNDDELEPEEGDDIRVVLRTVLLAQEPISVETIGTLSGLDDLGRVLSAIQPLRSVLHQSEQTGVVSTLHASFPDFMFSRERSGAHFCDTVKHSHVLAERCFLVMKKQLQFNICELETSFIPDPEVKRLEGRIKEKIPPPLAYVCRYWSNHLTLASKSEALVIMLDEFISHRLLFWMEVMNLRREMVMGYETLLKAKQWLSQPVSASPELVILVEDARNFVTSFASSPVAQSTPHIYISSLPLCPQSSSVYQNYWKQTRGLLELKGSLIERREAAALATWNLGSMLFSIAHSSDGTRVAAGCDDHTVRIMNAHDGKPLLDPLRGHTSWVRSVAFSPNGELVASGSDDCTVRVWNAYTGALATGPLAHQHWVMSVSFSPNGMQIVSGSRDRTICIWDAYNGALLRGPFAKLDSEVNSVTFSPDGVLIASASEDKTIRLWNTHDGTPATSPLKGHTDDVTSVAFTPDGNRLVSGSSDKTIRVWNTSDGSLATSPFKGHAERVFSVAVSPDGTQVASGSEDRTVRVWNIDDGTLVAGPFAGHTNWIDSVAFSPDGTRVISGSPDRTIRVWNVRDGLLPLPVPFEDHILDVESVSLPDNNTRILSRSSDSVWAWDITPEGIVPSLSDEKPDTDPPQMQSPETCRLTFTTDHCIEVRSKADGSLLAGPLRGHTDKIISSAFSADSRYLVTGSEDDIICVWDLKKAELVGVPFRGHASYVMSVALSPDASRVVSCSYRDETIRIWSIHFAMIPTPVPPSSSSEQSLRHISDPCLESWTIQKDGWVTNGSLAMLFWIPPDLASLHVWPSPHAEFIITRKGILQIVQKELYFGDRWSRCYVID